MGLLVSVGVLYGVILLYHRNHPLSANEKDQPTWLESCRQICAEYGPVPTGDIKVDDEAYLTIVDKNELTGTLEELLADEDNNVAKSGKHPLLGKLAPNFQLVNSDDKLMSLAELNQKGPVVLVFYYGFNCSHCVAVTGRSKSAGIGRVRTGHF
ncbi:MAG: redoxin domain-containing protein [Planctomycetaceae bacterium]|nr:redoxin domain-containing protein [Planctomycetaceae bacterium]